MSKISLISCACLCLLNATGTHAQTTPSSAEILRNIERSKPDSARSADVYKTIKNNQPEKVSTIAQRLVNVVVISPLFNDAIREFWRDEINKSISNEKLAEFKAFSWNLFQKNGYLPYITTKFESTNDGSVLTIQITLPKVGNISVTAPKGDNEQALKQEILRRFSEVYKHGTSIDIQELENRLTAFSYDLPVELEASLHQASESEVDISISIIPNKIKTGKLLSGTLQVNNYGLNQFGRTQMLGAIRIAGLTPSSEITVTTQQSDGVSYIRGEYALPLEGTHSVLHAYSSELHSNTPSSKGRSQANGVALTKLIQTDRIGRWLGTAELTNRKNQNWVENILFSDRIDNQLRLKILAESSNGWVDSFNNEISLSVGNMDLSRLPSDQESDTSSNGLNIGGVYKKIEMIGSISHSLDVQQIYTGYIRWRAQAASKNLDGYNRFALGGINGVRAFSATEGVGDLGAQVSFDITHQVLPDVWGGLFYDIGIIKTNRVDLPNATDTKYYTLQGVGWQIGGLINKVNWNISSAFAVGQTPGSSIWPTTNTQSGDTRTNLSLTYTF
jgi:hemolysin activation/secretion protein